MEERLRDYYTKISILLLKEIGISVRPNVKFDVLNNPYLSCLIYIQGEPVSFRFPLTKLGRRYLKEIREHWLKGIICGTISQEDVHTLFLPLSTMKLIHKYRSQLRNVTGLVRDKKLQNWIIWRRIKAKEIVEKLQSKH